MLGTLSVLRSNALNTGQNIVRGILGTVAGFVIGGALVEVIGTDTTLLWFLLPIAILIAGFAPAAISFAAGQAGFTVTLVILYNIIEPAGWRIGLVRIEDIVLGCAISLGVGLLFWPRGAVAALGTALSEAYEESARYLASAVEFGMGRCDLDSPAAGSPDGRSRPRRVGVTAAGRHLPELSRRTRRQAGSARRGDRSRHRTGRASPRRRRRARPVAAEITPKKGTERGRVANSSRAPSD